MKVNRSYRKMNFNASLTVNVYVIICIHCILGIIATVTKTGEYILHQDKEIPLEHLFETHSSSVITCGSLCLRRSDCEAYAFDPVTNKCIAFCGKIVNTVTYLTNTTQYYGTKREIPRDCLGLYREGERRNGVYIISPDRYTVINVYCDMDGGGWTLIQRRVDKSVNFTRGWDEYVNGFGDLSDNFWLGLKYIHLLTSICTPGDILFQVVTMDTNETALMQYSNFYIDGSANNYTMHVDVAGTYNTVATQHGFKFNKGFGYHNGEPFSTFDRPGVRGCVNGLFGGKGGWWYNACWVVLLNNPFDQMDVKSGLSGGKVIRSEIKVKRAL